MSEKVKKSILVQGSILAMAGIISRIIGFIYRVPMANILGNSGNGIYSVSFGIYNIALTLSSYSMPLAVSKLMSERLAKKEYKNANFLYGRALVFAFNTGLIACLVLYFGAESFAKLYNTAGLERPLKILAPTTFVVALLGTARGYFQGHRNMLPTAISQILEQIANAIVSVIGASMCIRMCSVEQDKGSYGAMGGTMGTLAGAIVGLIVFIVIYFLHKSEIKSEYNHEDERTEDRAIVFKAIFFTVLPVIISQTIYQLGYTLDDFIFSNMMHAKGYTDDAVSSLQGIFNTQYNQMINLPTAIATSMAATTLPSVVASYTVKDIEKVHKKVDLVYKIDMLIAVPSFIGLTVLADPIMAVLFPGLNELHDTTVMLLRTGSFAVVCYVFSTLTISVLQGCNHMRTPVINAGISLVIHVVMLLTLLAVTDLGVYALVIANVTFPLVTSALNAYKLKKILNYKFKHTNSFIKPLLSAIVMGIVALGVYYGGIALLGASYVMKCLMLVMSIIVAMLVYGIMLFVVKAFTTEEAKRFPIIKKFIK